MDNKIKILTWNCNGAFRNKFKLLDKFGADILIVQECENPEFSKSNDYKSWAGNYFWIGENNHKGLAIFSKGPQIQKLEWEDKGLKLFLPVRVSDKFNLLGVWTKANLEKHSRYIGQFWLYLQFNEIKISSNPIVIGGDFNSNKIWDYKPRNATHSDVIMGLEKLEILSLYHLFNNEKQGEETQPTFYLQKNTLKPFHIDYIFASKNLISKLDAYEVHKHSEWLDFSDHMPIVCEVKI
jgi:exonuclease III